MQQRLLASLLAGLALIIGLTTGCSTADDPAAALGRPCAEVRKDLEQAKAAQTDRAGTPDERKAADAVKKLETELKSCNDGTAATTTTEATTPDAEPTDDGDAGVADSDGELRSLPLAEDAGNVLNGDTTSDPRSPASVASAMEDGAMVTWQDAVERFGKLDWYVEAVNARKSKTGFDWEDVKKWAATPDIDPRVIHVFNVDVTDQQARDAVRELIGDSADKLPIARHLTCIVNTRGFKRETVQDFADCRKMIRVSLAPIVYNEKGEPVSVRSDTGVFVDCGNIWWIPRQVVPHGPPPEVSPPKVTTPPPSVTPPKKCPPDQPYGTWPACKDKPVSPVRPGHPMEGAAPAQPDPIGPPAGGDPPEEYVAPTVPKATPQPAPRPTPPTTAPPPPPTTTVPADDPEINLPDVGGDSGEF